MNPLAQDAMSLQKNNLKPLDVIEVESRGLTKAGRIIFFHPPVYESFQKNVYPWTVCCEKILQQFVKNCQKNEPNKIALPCFCSEFEKKLTVQSVINMASKFALTNRITILFIGNKENSEVTQLYFEEVEKLNPSIGK